MIGAGHRLRLGFFFCIQSLQLGAKVQKRDFLKNSPLSTKSFYFAEIQQIKLVESFPTLHQLSTNSPPKSSGRLVES